MPEYNGPEVRCLLSKWPNVRSPVYQGPTDEVLDSRWFAMSMAAAYAENPTLTSVKPVGDKITVAGRIEDIKYGNVIEFAGHDLPGIPSVRCQIPNPRDIPGNAPTVVVTVAGTIGDIQLGKDRDSLINIAITSGTVVSVDSDPSL